MKAALYPNFQKRNALSCAREACDVLAEAGIEVAVSEDFRSDFADKPHVIFEDMSISADTADVVLAIGGDGTIPVSYTHLRAHETPEHLVCRLLLEKKKQ